MFVNRRYYHKRICCALIAGILSIIVVAAEAENHFEQKTRSSQSFPPKENNHVEKEGFYIWCAPAGDYIPFLNWLEAKSIVKQTGKRQDDQSNEAFIYEMDIRKAYEHKKEICARFKMAGDDAATNILYGLAKAAIAFNDRDIIKFLIELPGPDGAGTQKKQDILREIKDAIPVTFFQVFLEQSKLVQEAIIPSLFDLQLASFSAVETGSLLTTQGEVYKLIVTMNDVHLQLLFKLTPEIMDRKPTLHGVFDFDGDGEEEIFIEWHEQREEYGVDHHYQVYKKKEGEYEVLGDFRIEDMMEDCYVGFIKEPDPDQPRKVLFSIRGGYMYEALYLLSRDGRSVSEVCGATARGHQDIDRDGVHEIMMIYMHSGENRFSIDVQFRYLVIFQWDEESFSYRKIWPEDNEVIAELYDVDDDGCDEIVALTDTGEEKEGRKLSIYKMSNRAFVLISQLDVTYPYIAFDIFGIRRLKDRKQIVLQLEEPRSREEIQKGPLAHGAQVMKGYNFKDGHLELAWANDKVELSGYASLIADTDGDGEKMIFMDRETGKPVMLRGEKEFINLYSMESHKLTPQGIAQPMPAEDIPYSQIIKWKRSLAEEGNADKGYFPYPPLLHCGTIYEASFNTEGTVYRLCAITPETGGIKWKFEREGVDEYPSPERGLPYVSSIAVEDGMVIAPTQRGHFVALDAQTGELRWEYGTGSYESILRHHGMQRNPAWLIPKVKNGLVYIKSEDGMLNILDLKTGEMRWWFDTGVSGFIPPLITEEKVYTQSRNGIAALNARTGGLIWETPLPLGWDWVNFTLSGIDQGSGAQVRYDEYLTTGLYMGLEAGDLILEVDGTPVQDVGEFVAVVQKAQHSQPSHILKIVRAGVEQTLQVETPEVLLSPWLSATWLSLALGRDTLYAGNMCDSTLYRLDADTGEVLWRVRDKAIRNVDEIIPHISGIYVFSGYRHPYRGYIKDGVDFSGNIAVFSPGGELYHRITNAGLPLLTYYQGKFYMMSYGQTAVDGEMVSEGRGTLTALSDTDGRVLWQTPLTDIGPVYATGASVCCARPWGVNLLVFDSITGEPLWQLPTTAYQFIGNNGLLLFVCSEDQLLAISLAEANWQLALKCEELGQWERFTKSRDTYTCLVPYEEAPSSVKKRLWEKTGVNWWGPDESIFTGENAVFFGPYPFDPRTNTRLWKDPGFDAISSEGHFEQIKAVTGQGVYYFTRWWYLGSSAITCRSLDTGETIWQREIPGEEQEIGEAYWTDTFAIANGQVYAELVAATEVPHNTEWSLYRVESVRLYAFDALTGETLWVFSVDPPAAPQEDPWYRPTVPLIVSDNLVYWGVEGSLYALDPTTGDIKWQFTDPDSLTKLFSNLLADPPETSLAVSEGIVCIGTPEKLYVLDAHTGDLKWQLPVEGLFLRMQASIYKGRVYAVAYDIKPPICSPVPASDDQQNNVLNLYLYSLRADTGEVDWIMTFPVQNQYTAEYIFDSDMIYLKTDAAVYALSAKTGELLWRFPHSAKLRLGKETVYVMCGRVYALDKVTGNVKWSDGYNRSNGHNWPIFYDGIESGGFLYLKVDAPGEFDPCRLIYVLDLAQAEKSLASGTRRWTEPAERKDIPTFKKISKRPISGFILENYWLGIGPFDNTDNKGLTVPYPPEREFDASATYQGKTREVRWQRPGDSQIDGLLRLYGILDEWIEGPDGWVSESHKWNEELNQWIWEPDEWLLAYALVDVISPDDRKVQLRIGSGDGVKVWLNGEVVWTNQIPRQIKLDEDIVPVELKKGSNRLLFKVGFSKDTRCCHFWGLIVRITDENGQPIEVLQYAIPR